VKLELRSIPAIERDLGSAYARYDERAVAGTVERQPSGASRGQDGAQHLSIHRRRDRRATPHRHGAIDRRTGSTPRTARACRAVRCRRAARARGDSFCASARCERGSGTKRANSSENLHQGRWIHQGIVYDEPFAHRIRCPGLDPVLIASSSKSTLIA